MEQSDEQMLLQMPERELILLARSGEQDAICEICNRYRQRLYETALAMLFSPAKAEAAVNAVLGDLPYSVREFNDDSLLLTWLCRKLIKHILQEHKLNAETGELQEIPT